MNRSFRAVTLVVFLLAAPFLHASEDDQNDPAFISLTREGTPVSKLPTNISVVTAQQIHDTGAKTLTDVLDMLPGVDVSRSGELGTLSTVRLRGVPTSNQVQILVDDQPLGGVSIQEINIGLIPVDNIERIEVVRGSSPILYGANTIGGVIHIITKKKSDATEAQLGFEARSFSTKINTAQLGGQAGSLNYFVTGSHYETEGYMDNSDANDTSVTSSFEYDLGNGSNVGLSADFIDHELGSPNGTAVPFDQWDGVKERVPNSLTQRVENGISRIRLKGATPVGAFGHLQSTFYESNESYKLRLTPSSDPLATFDNEIIGNDTRLVFTNGLVFGGSYERDARESLGQLPRDVTNWGLYGQHELNLDKFTVFPALRFDQHGTFGNEWNPRLSLVYRAFESWKVSANAARSFRAPTLVDLYIVATDPFFPAFDFYGNPNLKPETAWTYDLGTEVDVTRNVQVSMTGYHTQIEDRITAVDTDGNGNNDTYNNLSRAELTGIEMALSAQTGILSHSIGGIVQQAKGTTPTSTQFVHLRLTPRYLAHYQLAMSLPMGMRFINSLHYVDHQYQNDNKDGIKLPSYLLWNVRLEEKIKGVTLFAAINNISDKIYSESFTFGNPVPQATRNYAGGVSLTFR